MPTISRRHFLTASAAVPALLPAAESPLPWNREQPLRDAARAVFIEGVLQARCPQPDAPGVWPGGGPAMLTSNPSVKASLWGPPERITLSVMKNDVYDRRVAERRPVTLEEVRKGAFSPANKDFNDQRPGTRRPPYGLLAPEGGRFEPYLYWAAYPFPCPKPVGQIILGADGLRGAPEPRLRQRCSDGVIEFEAASGEARGEIRIVLSATRNVFAIDGRFAGPAGPLSLRLYRNRDQAHRAYMNPDGTFLRPANPEADARQRMLAAYPYESESSWNGPVDPPETGSEGRFFWLVQRMPPEKTFPKGFKFVVMGLVTGRVAVDLANGKKSLGTPPFAGPQLSQLERGYAWMREATGSAATATLEPQDGRMRAYIAVVSVMDAADPLAEARKRLLEAEALGLDGIARENAEWYGHLYDRREAGRVFYGASGRDATDDIRAIYRSWYCHHGGCYKTDARRFQAGAHYASLENEWPSWHGLPCYNEAFYTPSMVRNRADSVDMWWQLVEHWLPAARRNARDLYGMPGMMLVHGYLPPIKPDRYINTNSALEFCLDTAAQVLKVLWDEWDYGGDEKFLRAKLYPALRDLAAFYAAFVRKGPDGYYHAEPVVEAEAWGITPGFARNRDTIAALCMFRWTFQRAAEAAALLGKDPVARKQWLEIASRLAPYPTWDLPSGKVFNALPGVAPSWQRGDHPWYIGVYPTTLSDDLNLDSTPAEIDMMLRTARSAPASPNREVFALLGRCKNTVASLGDNPAPIADTETLRREINAHPERVINSRSGRIHLFPCVPDRVEIAFRRFQARGGFLVSAVRGAAGVSYVEIESRRAAVCKVMNPWPGRKPVLTRHPGGQPRTFSIDRGNGECLIFDTRPGAYQLRRS